jgi:RNA polymerase sigma-32 factor
MALKYRRYRLSLSEMIAEDNFGLVHALSKFEPEHGTRFVTYAAYWIRAFILDYIICSWSLVGVGTGPLRSKLFFRLRRERARIQNLVGEGEQADTLLAERFGTTRDQMNGLLQRLDSRDLSLGLKVSNNAVTSLVDILPFPGSNQEQTYGTARSPQLYQDG